jgi:hypothetical protein
MLKIFLVLITLVGCSTRERDTLKAYREAFALGDFSKAAELLKKSGLEKKANSKLLLLMEQGRLAYVSEDYASAVKSFNEAIELVDAQYTKSLTREGSKWIVNDGSGEFFGSPYERSWLFYHQAMAYLKLYQTGAGEDPRRNLFAARAALLAWDSFFQEWIRATEGKTIYRHDIVAKVVAAQVHEATGLRNDLQIAINLYQDALKLLSFHAPLYASFNVKSSEYVATVSEVLNQNSKFISPRADREETTHAFATRKFLIERLVALTQQVRPSELANYISTLGITAEEINEARKNNLGNVVVVLEEGVIPPKIPKKINLGIQGLASLSKDKKTQMEIARVGSEVMAVFAVQILGLAPRQNASYGDYRGAHALMTVAAHEVAIAFEVPAIEKGPAPEEMWVKLTNAKGESFYQPLNVLTHLEDVAKLTLEEESSQRILRTGVRVAMKHISAIIGAMAVYKGMNNKKDPNPFAKYAAVASYVAATKAIAMSERADTRAWSTLPRTLRMAEFSMPEGKYTLSLAQKVDQNSFSDKKLLSEIKVQKNKAIFTYSLPQI